MRLLKHGSALTVAALLACGGIAHAQDTEAQTDSSAKKPNILLIVSDDTGWGDLGPYLGGEARGMQTPNFDRLGQGRHGLHQLLRPAELHAGPRRDPDRTHSEPQRHDHRGLPGPGRRSSRRRSGPSHRC